MSLALAGGLLTTGPLGTSTMYSLFVCFVPWGWFHSLQFSSVAQSCLTLRPLELQHARPPCPSPTPRVHPNSCPSSQWCHPAISSSVIPFYSCPQFLPASKSFPMSQLFAWGWQSIGVLASALILPKNTQDWSLLGLAGSPCSPRDSQESSPTPQFKSIHSLRIIILRFTWWHWAVTNFWLLWVMLLWTCVWVHV